MIRYGLIGVGIAALIAAYAIAANESLSRGGRFVALVIAGGVVLAGWPGLAVFEPVARRRPLRLHWGKPVIESGAAVPAAPSVLPDEIPVRAELRLLPTLGALVASVVAAPVLGVIGYALAGSASDDGGFLVYPALVGAVWVAARSLIRIVTRGRAVVLTGDEVRLGAALGYLPELRLSRSAVEAIGASSRQPALVAFVTRSGRRFDVAADQLEDQALPNYVAAVWPEVPWTALPESV